MAQAAVRNSTPISRANRNHPLVLRRAALERAIEAAIATLDALDGDDDHEIVNEDGCLAGERPRYGENQALGPVTSTGRSVILGVQFPWA